MFERKAGTSTVTSALNPQEVAMGEAPKIIEGIRRSRAQVQEDERQWHLDADTGELKPEAVPDEVPEVRPQPIRVARQTFD